MPPKAAVPNAEVGWKGLIALPPNPVGCGCNPVAVELSPLVKPERNAPVGWAARDGNGFVEAAGLPVIVPERKRLEPNKLVAAPGKPPGEAVPARLVNCWPRPEALFKAFPFAAAGAVPAPPPPAPAPAPGPLLPNNDCPNPPVAPAPAPALAPGLSDRANGLPVMFGANALPPPAPPPLPAALPPNAARPEGGKPVTWADNV